MSLKGVKLEVHHAGELMTPKLSAALGRIMFGVGTLIGVWLPRDAAVFMTVVIVLSLAWVGLHMLLNPHQYAQPFSDPEGERIGLTRSPQNKPEQN